MSFDLFFGDVEQPSSLVPSLNVGGLLDIPTGSIAVGLKGESFINGGLSHITGVVGEGNVGKTQLTLWLLITAIANYVDAQGLIYDSEGNLKKPRQVNLARSLYKELLYSTQEIIDSKGTVDEYDLRRIVFTSIAKYSGDEIWRIVRNKAYTHGKNDKKANFVETPFKDRDGSVLRLRKPILMLLDSLSMFKVAAHDEFSEEDLGSSKRNMESMRKQMAKTQLIMDLPEMCARNNFYFITTAHVGQQHQIDVRQPPKKIFEFLSQKQKLKDVPEKFLFTPQTMFFVAKAKPAYVSSSDKTPLYPRSSKKGYNDIDTDLTNMTILCLRNKDGNTGIPLEIMASQSEGILPSLSQFHFCKTHNRYGIGGTLEKMYMEFYPEVVFTRKNIRELLRENHKLANAMRLTSEILQCLMTYPVLSESYQIHPSKIYEIIKEKGYNWDELLETRGHWLPDQYTNEVKFLSGMDLINMCTNEYKPYWMR